MTHEIERLGDEVGVLKLGSVGKTSARAQGEVLFSWSVNDLQRSTCAPGLEDFLHARIEGPDQSYKMPAGPLRLPDDKQFHSLLQLKRPKGRLR